MTAHVSSPHKSGVQVHESHGHRATSSEHGEENIPVALLFVAGQKK